MTRTITVSLLFLFVRTLAADEIRIPAIDGEWWDVAGNPDLGAYTTDKQDPVDFGVWQAADGTWQLWSCIRHTGCGGHTRLFHRWEGKNLTDRDWKPMGIAMEARTDLGESLGGLQAPHVVKHDGRYSMAYGDWVNICFAASTDGKTFERIIQRDGKTGAFSEGLDSNTRDPMLIRIDGLWHRYYTAKVGERGYFFCRTSPELAIWSDSFVVAYGGTTVGPSPWQIECPFVVEYGAGVFYLFRNQFYGEGARNWVYRSTNPRNFGIDSDDLLVSDWPVAAPEIVQHGGQYYVAALKPGLDGIRLARLRWIPKSEGSH